MQNDWLVLAYQLDGVGGGQALTAKDLQERLQPNYWVHLDINYPAAEHWLHHQAELDPHVVEMLAAEETRPRVVEFERSVVVILRGVNLNEDADPEDMVSIRVYIDEQRVISTRRRKLKAVTDLEERIGRGAGPGNGGALLAMLCSRLGDRMEASITRLGELTDDIEQEVLDNPGSNLRHQIVGIRKQAIMFRRYLSPQRDALAKLRSTDLKLFSKSDKRSFQESYDRTVRFVEDLDAVRERAQIVQDELTTLLTDRLNKNTYLLSVIAAIFLPLGFFTGLLGINVGGLPGVEDPMAFWEFSFMLVLLVIIQILVFKWRKWF